MGGFKRCSNADCETEFPATRTKCPNCKTRHTGPAEVEGVQEIAPDARPPNPDDRVTPGRGGQGTHCTCFCLPEGGDICADCGKPARPLVNASAPDESQPAGGIGASQPATHSEPVSPAEPVTIPPPCPRLQIRFGADTVLHIGHSLLLGRGYAGVAPVLYEYLAGLTGISRRHCLIQWDEHGGWLTDLGSTNGTRANGAVLRAGEAMRITVNELPLTVSLGHYAYCTIDAQETPI